MSEHTNDKWVYGQRTNIATLLDKPNLRQCEHAGLWFDAYINRQQKKDTSLGKEEISPYKELVDIVAAIPEPQMYQRLFQRWKEQIETMQVAVDGYEYMVQCKYAAAQGRIALGLGDKSVIETGITLHHTYGVPFIPGSALKGLASAYAHRFLEGENWRKGGEYHTAMFGTTDSAGYVVFLDAMYCPGTGHPNPKSEGKAQALWPDVITVHHPNYYTGSDPKPPADWDSPRPVPFLTATGTYLIALGGPLAWVNLGFKILEKALAEMGIGAKTSSGYGRMKFEVEQQTTSKTTGDPNPVIQPGPGEKPKPPIEPPAVGMVITGQRARQIERFDFKDRRIRGVGIVPNKDQITAPPKRKLIILVEDQQTGGGFRGEIIDIDDSNNQELRILVKPVRRPKEGS